MIRKIAFVHNFLFAAVVVAVVVFCTGCFSQGTWDDLGKTEVILPEYSMRFALTPDGDEIVFSGRQKTHNTSGVSTIEEKP